MHDGFCSAVCINLKNKGSLICSKKKDRVKEWEEA